MFVGILILIAAWNRKKYGTYVVKLLNLILLLLDNKLVCSPSHWYDSTYT